MALKLFFTLLICSTCSSGDSQSPIETYPEQYQYVAPELQVTDINKLLGNWTLRASSNRDLSFTRLNQHYDDDKLQCQVQYPPNGDTALLVVRQLNHSKAYVYSSTGQNSQLPERIVLGLYIDRHYIVDVMFIPALKAEYLQVWARPEVDFDGEYAMELIMNQLWPDQAVRRLIAPHLFRLEFIKHDLSGYYPPPPRQFTENQHADITFDLLSGVFDLRYTTDEAPLFDYIIANHNNDVLKVKRIKGTELQASTTEYRVPDTRRTFRMLSPVQREAPHLRSWPVQVDYLYVNNDTVVAYEFCRKYEAIRIYVRQGLAIAEDFGKIPSPVLFKLRDLMAKIKLHHETTDRNIVLEYQVISEFRHIEADVDPINDLRMLAGNWTLRASTDAHREQFYTHKVSGLTDEKAQTMTTTTYMREYPVATYTKTRILGSKGIKTVPSDTLIGPSDIRIISLGLRILYVFYVDHNYLIVLGVMAYESDRPSYLKIFARGHVDFDSQKELELLEQHVFSKPNLKKLLEPKIFDLQFMQNNYRGFWPQPPITFAESELADFNYSKIVGAFDLRYTSDPESFERFHYAISAQTSLDKQIFTTLRMSEDTIKQNITELKFEHTHRHFKVATTQPAQSAAVKTKPFFVEYLYVDDNVYVVYEFGGIEPVMNHLRLYVRQGIRVTPEEAKQYLDKMAPSAMTKVADLAAKIRPHYVSQRTLPTLNQLVGNWVLVRRWPGDVVGDSTTSLQALDNRFVVKTFVKGVEVDEVSLTPIAGSNQFRYASNRTDGCGVMTLTYADLNKRMIWVVDGSAGLSVDFYSKQKWPVTLINIKFITR